MRLLLFKHSETCGAAIKERDRVAALASCLISEKMLRQPWLDLDLFAHVSIEEMRITKEILERCSEQMSSIREMLDENDLTIVDEIIPTIEKIDKYDMKRRDLSARIREFIVKPSTNFWFHRLSKTRNFPFYMRTDFVDFDVDENTTIYELFDEQGYNLWRREEEPSYDTYTIGDINLELCPPSPRHITPDLLPWTKSEPRWGIYFNEQRELAWDNFLEWFSGRDPSWIVWMLKKKSLDQLPNYRKILEDQKKSWLPKSHVISNLEQRISELGAFEKTHAEFDNWCVESNNIDEAISEIISEANPVLGGKFLIEY
jgi:hypothetical protein